MAKNHQANSSSPERRPVLVSSGSSSSELSSSGPTKLQPFSLGRVSSFSSSSSNLSSITVPVRLDVLYFLLNSAAKGAQYALPPTPIHGGQGSFAMCHCPAAHSTVSCCHSSCHSVPSSAGIQQQPGGVHQQGAPYGGYGGCGGLNSGVREHQNDGCHWTSVAQQGDGKSWSDCSPSHLAGGWKRTQSPMGWKENQRGGGEGGDRATGGSWQGKQQNFRRSWGDRRQGTVESSSWKSGLQGWRREGSPFRSSTSNGKRNPEGSHWQNSREAPEAKRSLDGATRKGWQKTQGTGESASFVGKAKDAGLVKTAAQESGEDWEVDYESGQSVVPATGSIPCTPHQNDHSNTSEASEDWEKECASSADPPKLRLLTSPLPESASKDQGVTAADWSKKGRFLRYLKNLYTDLPGKSSSEGSTDLTIDTEVKPSEPDEEEQSLENAAVAESKS
ncbi:uncharacterized protein LOC133372438 isoform X2 [Rhineura floridana]|nr:uncharacterized protein LOC133372438 isoform X2 [Rhineura floridana]